MKSAFRFRLYPNREQERRMLLMVEAGRQLWNEALAHRKRRWEEKRLSTSYHQQCLILTTERRVNPLFRALIPQRGTEKLPRPDKTIPGLLQNRARYPADNKVAPGAALPSP